MRNHPKDRHVLAAAVKAEAQTIVTYNVRDFPAEPLTRWAIECQKPDDFLVHQYHLQPKACLAKLREQASAYDLDFETFLGKLCRSTPKFVQTARFGRRP